MHPPKDVFHSFLNWAKCSFQEEVATEFKRAQSIDAYIPNAILQMLKKFPIETLKTMAGVLPISLWIRHPAAESLIGQLPESDKAIAEEFKQAVQHLLRENWQEISNLVARKRQPSTLHIARQIKTIGPPIVREFAATQGYNAEKIDSEVWRLSAVRRWGRISAAIDFQSPLELTYAIFVEDMKGIPIRQGDHYLGVLGIAPTAWSIPDPDECRQKVLNACDFIQWHLSEYIKVMDVM